MRLCSKILPGFLFGYEHLVEVRLEGQLLTSSRSMSRSEDFLHQAIYLLFKIRPREFDLPAPSIKSCLCSLHRYNLIGASGEMLKHKFQGSSSILTTARIDSILLMSQRALERWPWSLYDSLQTALVYGPRVSHNMESKTLRRRLCAVSQSTPQFSGTLVISDRMIVDILFLPIKPCRDRAVMPKQWRPLFSFSAHSL